MSYETFCYELTDGVGTIRLNRPRTLNSLTFAVYAELVRATRELRDDAAVRAVLITGEGKGFCSGGDVHEIIGQLQKRDTGGLVAFTRLTGELTKGLLSIGKPTVAAINGIAAGAGAVIACACDIRIGTPLSRFGFVFTRVGLTGADMGIAYLLPRLVGLAKATELLYLGDIVEADEALRLGLLNRLVQPEELEAAAREMATRLAQGPTFAMRMTKELLHKEYGMDLNAAIELEAQAQALCMQTLDHHEGYQSFVEKRSPRFVGR